MPETAKQYYAAIGQCKEIFLKKTRDYGASWKILRMPSITDQIYIKAERIRTIEDKKVKKVEESIEGEFMGIVNYCAIALMLLDLQTGTIKAGEDLENATFLEKVYDERIKLAFDTMERKNHDYGEAWRNMRTSSFTDLILMKLLRLKQIEENEGNTLISEGPDANYIDILNYAVFALIQLSGVRPSKP